MERPILVNLNENIRGINFLNSLQNCYQLTIAFNKFYSIYYIFAGANFSLGKAIDENLNISEYETNGEEVLRNFFRGEYLKSTILSYKSIEDYVMQIVVFGFNLNEKSFKNKDQYDSVCKNLYYWRVIDLLNDKIKCNKKNRYLTRVKKILEKYHRESNIKEISKIANAVKHGGNVSFEEIPDPIVVRYKGKDYDSNWMQPKKYKLDMLIDMCYKANPIIKGYVEEIYNLIIDEYPEYKLEKI